MVGTVWYSFLYRPGFNSCEPGDFNIQVCVLNFKNAMICEKGLNADLALNCLPNDKILDRSKVKALADDNLNAAKPLHQTTKY